MAQQPEMLIYSLSAPFASFKDLGNSLIDQTPDGET